MQKFFMVYGEGKAAPNKKHDTMQEAQAEAERLAKQHPGVTFHVLEPICRVATSQPAVTWETAYRRFRNYELAVAPPAPLDRMTADQMDEAFRIAQINTPPPVQITPDDAIRAAGAVHHQASRRYPHNGDAFIEDFQP